MRSAACHRCRSSGNMQTATPHTPYCFWEDTVSKGAWPAPCPSPSANQALGALKNKHPHPHQGPLMRHGYHCVAKDAIKPLRSPLQPSSFFRGPPCQRCVVRVR